MKGLAFRRTKSNEPRHFRCTAAPARVVVIRCRDVLLREPRFTKEWEYRPNAHSPDPGFLGLVRDGVRLHLSSLSDDGVSGGVVCFAVRDVDALFAEFQANGIVAALSPTDQTWGNREMYVRDPDGNALRFIQYRR